MQTTDGANLHLWQFRAKAKGAPKAVLLQLHGNAQNMTSHFSLMYPLVGYGYDLVSFDYRGYGKSTGEPSPHGVVEDTKTLLRWLKVNYPNTPIVVVAHSIGGAIAARALIELKNEVPIQLLVLDSTFSSYRSIARAAMSRSWVTWPLQPVAWLIVDNSKAPKGQLDQLGPYKKIVVHGTNDRVVEHRFGEEIFNDLSEPKEFWSIPKGEHIDFMWRNNGEYAKKLLVELEAS